MWGLGFQNDSPKKSGKEKDDDYDQDLSPKDLLHIWSWSSENLLLKKDKDDDRDQDCLKKIGCTYGHGPLKIGSRNSLQ